MFVSHGGKGRRGQAPDQHRYRESTEGYSELHVIRSDLFRNG